MDSHLRPAASRALVGSSRIQPSIYLRSRSQEEKKATMSEIEKETTYLRVVIDSLVIPQELENLISEVMFVEPPELHQLQP